MIHEGWLAEWAPQICAAGDRLAFDIGANDGTWTTTLRHWFARVASLEPDLRCVPPPGHTYDRRAVAAAVGTATLYQRTSHLQSSLLADHAVGDSGAAVEVVRQVEVATVTLDELAAEYGSPQFVKVDIEGGEIAALQGATSQCYRTCSWLIELHDTRQAVLQEFDRLGYSRVQIMPHPSPLAGHGHEWLFAAPEVMQ